MVEKLVMVLKHLQTKAEELPTSTSLISLLLRLHAPPPLTGLQILPLPPPLSSSPAKKGVFGTVIFLFSFAF